VGKLLRTPTTNHLSSSFSFACRRGGRAQVQVHPLVRHRGLRQQEGLRGGQRAGPGGRGGLLRQRAGPGARAGLVTQVGSLTNFLLADRNGRGSKILPTSLEGITFAYLRDSIGEGCWIETIVET
jgi:hypothetical protein